MKKTILTTILGLTLLFGVLVCTSCNNCDEQSDSIVLNKTIKITSVNPVVPYSYSWTTEEFPQIYADITYTFDAIDPNKYTTEAKILSYSIPDEVKKIVEHQLELIFEQKILQTGKILYNTKTGQIDDVVQTPYLYDYWVIDFDKINKNTVEVADKAPDTLR